MVATQAVKYAPQCGDMTMESVQFQSNNFVGNFNYPQSVPTYKDICNFLMNCSLAEDFTKTPSPLYQNYLREFWCTVMASDLNPPIDSSKARPYREFIIKFTIKNGQNPLNLDYKTFCESTGLDYNNGQYVDHPSTKVVKAELAKIATNEALVQKTLVLKTSFPVAWRILLTFVVQVLGGNYLSTEHDLVTRLMAKSREKYVSYPRFVLGALERLLGSDYPRDQKFRNLPNALSQSNFTKDPSKVTPVELTASMIDVINHESSVTLLPLFEKKRKKKSQTVAQPKPKSQALRLSEHSFKRRKNTKGNIQPTVKGFHSPLDEGTRSSKPFPKGKMTDPQDIEGNKQPNVMGFPTTHQDEGKTSSEVEPDTETLLLTIVADIQSLLGDSDDELKYNSDDEVFEAREEMDEEIQQIANEETQSPKPSKEPISTEYQFPSPKKDNPKPLNAKKSADSQDASDSESSSCSKTFKLYDNFILVTKRVLAVASYADLRGAVKGYTEENVKHRAQTDTALSHTMDLIDTINKARVEEITSLLKTLNRVSETL
ncbi:hypothetical protein Tco_1239015 [Tanacetum coccineum]